MLADVADVITRAGVLLDDPSNSAFTSAYLMPMVDQCYDVLDVELERAGMQYIENTAQFVNPAGTWNLAPLLQDGQPLATMKFPKIVKWKLPGQPDSMLNPSQMVSELTEYDAANGAFEWRFADGALQVTKCSIDIELRVYFDEMSTNIIDPSNNVVRGTAHILAFAVAKMAAGRRKGMENLAKDLKADYMAAWNAFKTVLVKNNQGKQTTPPPMHATRRSATPNVPAPTS